MMNNWMKTLTHWGLMTHICVGNLSVIGSDNGLSPHRYQAIIWTNAVILLIAPLGTHFTEILIEMHTFSFKKMYLKMSSTKSRLFCLSLNELRDVVILFSALSIFFPGSCDVWSTARGGNVCLLDRSTNSNVAHHVPSRKDADKN